MKVSTAPTSVCNRFSPMIGVASESTRRCVMGWGAAELESGTNSARTPGAAGVSAAWSASSIVACMRPPGVGAGPLGRDGGYPTQDWNARRYAKLERRARGQPRR